MADTDMRLLMLHIMCELAPVHGLWTAVLDTSRITYVIPTSLNTENRSASH